ncbi:sensor histidine kinase [Kitasatospora sp. RB6PN24]|uniref:sensor histidine kinase n=1 Tax=Kitasatospora humi TaxID=2893891 RepID=UPI001E3E3790|nr:sensor histidine kinase [Kitasatospora humi]MCC9307503.1 sensor histidine kinase [Kitasatospora humi]
MNRFDSSALAAPAPTGHAASTPALRMMNLALHGLFFTLLAVLVVRGLITGELGQTSLLTAITLGSLYGLGGVGQRIRADRRWAGAWLAGVLVLWSGLTVVHPEFSYLAFPLYFLLLHLLSVLPAIPAVLGVTGIVVAAQAQTAGGLTTAKVVGPLAGLAVAVLTAAGYAALYRESRARARAVDVAMRMVHELTEARNELARSQRAAGRLAERQRLAAEIHDTLAQGLSSIVLLARSAESALPSDPSAAAERIGELGRTAAENLAEARRFVRELTPPALEEASLSEALRRLAERRGADFHLEGEPCPLPVEGEVALLRLTQQALANAVQHAQATRIAVTLGYLDHEVTLDVFDDGVGFDPHTHRSGEQSGFGLHGMRERMAALGGVLTVESAPGEGTAVAAAIPIPAVDVSPGEQGGDDGALAARRGGRGGDKESTLHGERSGKQEPAGGRAPAYGEVAATGDEPLTAGVRTGGDPATSQPKALGGEEDLDDAVEDLRTWSHVGGELAVGGFETSARHQGDDRHHRAAGRLKPTPPIVTRLMTGRFVPRRRVRGALIGERSHS